MGLLQLEESRQGNFNIIFRYNEGPEEILKTLIDEIIDRNSTKNPETGEIEFKPVALATDSFKIGTMDKSSIAFEEKKEKEQVNKSILYR